MGLKDNMRRDLDAVMFNADEFADAMVLDGREVRGIWSSKSDITLSGDFSAPAPRVTFRREDVPDIANGQLLVHDGKSYRIGWIEWTDTTVVRAYLSEDLRSEFHL